MKPNRHHTAGSRANKERWSMCAAVYVRMSTDLQQYSTSNQMDKLREYAKTMGFTIVKVYSDLGKSGLNIEGREALEQMLSDVQEGRAEYANILVYDVSRWGRFQNPDESAYYDFSCQQAGVRVHFCAEQFTNDGSPVSSIIKSIKRTMAGEFSRELSSKVYNGCCTLAKLGFRQGGAAGYGLRRLLVDSQGQKKFEMKMGEKKSLQTDRVVLVAGPPEEVEVVQRIYQQFITGGKVESEIAAGLNAQGLVTDFGRAWNRGTVHEILINEKYIGNNVYSRTSGKLKQKIVDNPPAEWVRAAGAYAGIVAPELFLKVQEIILARSRKYSDAEMLDHLRAVLSKHGRISGILINEMDGLPSSTAFSLRFGTLINAYLLIGYNPGIDFGFVEENRRLRKRHPELVAEVIQKITALGAQAAWNKETELLDVNHEMRVSIVLCRHSETATGSSRWLIRLDASARPDVTVAVRMDANNEGIRDYYVLPGLDMTWENLRVTEANGIYMDTYRCDTLDNFYGMAERVKFEEAL
jgi:DNA invertase Pin-like site-specific DNA recombinase